MGVSAVQPSADGRGPGTGVLRVGMFGGAFDPPHTAHRALVEAALQQLQLDRLHVVPTGQAWHKPRQLSDVTQRIAMAELAFGDLPRVVVDTRETQRSGPSYTVDTLRELQSVYPAAQLYLCMGEDQALALPTWHDWQGVLQRAIVCVAARQGADAAPFQPPAAYLDRFLTLRFAAQPVSATAIRAQAAAGDSITPLVGDAVARYIDSHRLYQAT